VVVGAAVGGAEGAVFGAADEVLDQAFDPGRTGFDCGAIRAAAKRGAAAGAAAGAVAGGIGAAASRPSSGFPSPEAHGKVPKEWGGPTPTKKGTGVRWQDPKNKGNGIRIDRGNPNSSSPSQRPDHVVVNSNGRVIGRDGNPINGAIHDDPVNAHIPLSEWVTWSTWNRP